ncbi:hypothetical protein IDH44_10645 [Paenibacillus sp. IB182496]|uniref:DUF2834 domain-containing protein n=1 Tax=Paenibacillus sabuli TaxID=2772509 RepID=A0A927BST7_9BACL|nr:hypothetical protein [Paenibacillus sabuli]MBD2845647.1 hypothetical protein [Paenibacillus sabuli]
MRLLWFIVWVLFIGYAVWLAPGEGVGDDPIFAELLRLQAEEPLVLMMFALLGVFPLVYACLLLRDDRGSWPAWPFVVLSLGLGAFALLPYFFVSLPGRRIHHRVSGGLRSVCESRLVQLLLLALTLGLVAWGVGSGDPEAYAEAFMASHFVHVMTLDFVLLALLSVYAIANQQRGYRSRPGAAWLGLLPLVGPLLYTLFSRVPR